VKVTVPVGVVGFADVSVTVAVQVVEAPSTTVSGLHFTIVEVVSMVGGGGGPIATFNNWEM
jgi:hypothetical protein